MEYCVMCVDTGCFGAKVKLIFLFSVSHSSKTVGPRDCVKLQRYSCYCAIQKTLPPDHLVVNEIAKRDPALFQFQFTKRMEQMVELPTQGTPLPSVLHPMQAPGLPSRDLLI
jgi:hypothetical protein